MLLNQYNFFVSSLISCSLPFYTTIDFKPYTYHQLSERECFLYIVSFILFLLLVYLQPVRLSIYKCADSPSVCLCSFLTRANATPEQTEARLASDRTRASSRRQLCELTTHLKARSASKILDGSQIVQSIYKCADSPSVCLCSFFERLAGPFWTKVTGLLRTFCSRATANWPPPPPPFL